MDASPCPATKMGIHLINFQGSGSENLILNPFRDDKTPNFAQRAHTGPETGLNPWDFPRGAKATASGNLSGIWDALSYKCPILAEHGHNLLLDAEYIIQITHIYVYALHVDPLPFSSFTN